jgi:hypothetical protein
MNGKRVVVRNLVTATRLCQGALGQVESRFLEILSASPVAGNGGVEEPRLTGFPEAVLSLARAN